MKKSSFFFNFEICGLGVGVRAFYRSTKKREISIETSNFGTSKNSTSRNPINTNQNGKLKARFWKPGFESHKEKKFTSKKNTNRNPKCKNNIYLHNVHSSLIMCYTSILSVICIQGSGWKEGLKISKFFSSCLSFLLAWRRNQPNHFRLLSSSLLSQIPLVL